MTFQNERLSELLTVRITPSLLETLYSKAHQLRLPYQHVVRQILAEAVAETDSEIAVSTNEKNVDGAGNKGN